MRQLACAVLLPVVAGCDGPPARLVAGIGDTILLNNARSPCRGWESSAPTATVTSRTVGSRCWPTWGAMWRRASWPATPMTDPGDRGEEHSQGSCLDYCPVPGAITLQLVVQSRAVETSAATRLDSVRMNEILMRLCFPDLPAGECWPRDGAAPYRGCYPSPRVGQVRRPEQHIAVSRTRRMGRLQTNEDMTRWPLRRV
jgi:hypothetical protein